MVLITEKFLDNIENIKYSSKPTAGSLKLWQNLIIISVGLEVIEMPPMDHQSLCEAMSKSFHQKVDTLLNRFNEFYEINAEYCLPNWLDATHLHSKTFQHLSDIELNMRKRKYTDYVTGEWLWTTYTRLRKQCGSKVEDFRYFPHIAVYEYDLCVHCWLCCQVFIVTAIMVAGFRALWPNG